MIIALGADHGGFELKEIIKKHLLENNYEIKDYGTDSAQSVDYPVYGFYVGEAIIKQEADLGIVVCGTGLGISIAANKVRGIRAAVCTNGYMARMAREHNNANILALGARVVGEGLALEIVDAFLQASFGGERHARRINLISEYEK
ncbi:MAG: ribose 5-phosphate isomerase B [Peptococcaceae bacterium]|jgi:ribose 5-phosphate isomerase B|nr:ribose 5-phosphate isomerase B [Peptococcaceae bacterium]